MAHLDEILLFSGFMLGSVVCLIIAALAVRLWKEKKWWKNLHHITIIAGYILITLAYIGGFGRTLDEDITFITLLMIAWLVATLSLIVGPFNLKYRDSYKGLKILHLLIGYITIVLIFIAWLYGIIISI